MWDLVLAALSLVAIWIVLSRLASAAPPREGALLVAGAAALAIVASQLLNHPPAAQGASPQSGAWLALAGSALMAVGGALSAARVSLVVSFSPRAGRDDRNEGPAPPAPPAPRRREPSAATEAAAVEPEVHDELYPEQERSGPIGADDPELWKPGSEDETLPFDAKHEERS